MEKLPDSLEEALQLILKQEMTALPELDIKKLLAIIYISPKHKAGWMVNSEGTEYLRRFKD